VNNKLKNYIIYICLITIALMVGYYFFKDKLALQTAYIIPAFFLITLVGHMILMRAVTRDAKKFYINFIGAMAFKMLAYFFFLTIMFLAYKEINTDFLVVFMSVYLVYTVFEMIYVYPIARKNN